MLINLKVYLKSKQSEHKERLCRGGGREGVALRKTDFAVFNNKTSNKEEHGLLDQSRKSFTGLKINIHANQHLYFHITL